MTTREGLLHAVIETPADDAPRLVFSDWLEEHGELDRAEFIRVQCEIARGVADRDRLAELARREEELWEAHGAAWLEEVPKWSRDKVAFRRGFASGIRCTPTQWLGARGLTRKAPIESLWVTWANRMKIEVFAACEHLAGLTALKTWLSWGEDPLPLLLSPHLGNLRCLDLRRGSYTHGSTRGDRLARALAEAAHLAGLEGLDLSWNEVGPNGAKALATSPHLTRLRMLALSEDHIGHEGVQALVASPNLKHLEHLHLRAIRLGPAGAEVIASSPHLARLTTLDLHFGRIGTAGARALAASPHLANLTYLNLFGNGIGDAGARALAESPYLTRLHTLELGNNGLSETGLRALREATALANLERLGLYGTPDAQSMAGAFVGSPGLPRLKEVKFYPYCDDGAVRREMDDRVTTLSGRARLKRAW
jgi:uncharacterized protein (TIGR02996 family)